MSQGIRTSAYGQCAIKAACEGKYIVHQLEDGKTYVQNSAEAVKKLATKMGWYGHWVGVTAPQVRGMVWVCVEDVQSDYNFHVHNAGTVPFEELKLNQGDEPTGPEEGDIATSDDIHWYQYEKLYLTGNEADLVKKMGEDNFWPNVWRFSDHGNYNLLRINLNQKGRRT